MKKKSASQSAFFNVRVLIGLLILVAGVFLALAAVGTFSGITANSAQAQPKHKIIDIQGLPPGFDCATIYEKGYNKMESLRAGLIMIACGEAQGGGSGSPSSAFSRLIQKLEAPLAYGAADVDLITGADTPPHIVQSETYSTANPDNPDQICVAYNDSRSAVANNFSGVSCSTDGGTTFTRLTKANGQSPFANTFGDPVILYHKPSQTWLTVWIDANAGCTLGGYKSTTPTDPNSWTHFCVHAGISDDRESGYADNNPSSPFFGRMYITWNDFGQSEQIRSTFSSDGGLTWSNPVNVNNTFIRNVQVTADKVTGDVYIAGMDENGGSGCTTGCGSNRNNKIYRSTDGGGTYTNTYTGSAFVGPCRSASGFFCDMYANPAYWRHMGWGQVGAYNGVVHYDYAAKNGNDPGDVFYIRSTDMGVTFSTPFQLNANTDPAKAQWEPNLSVSDAGTVFATWYDETPRTSASCQPSSPTNLCYQMHSRKSNDNGVTWLSDDTLSDAASPLPLQGDSFIVTEYVGDYDYGSSIPVKHVTSWVDGRTIISGASQQDAYTDRELVGFAVTSTDPACNAVINTQPTDFIINLSDAVDPSTVDPCDFTVNGTCADSFTLSNGNATITFHFNSSPVTGEGSQTMHIPADAFNRISDGMGNFEFNCTFCYAVTPLQVTTTNPPVGGTFSPPAPGDYTYDVNFNQAVDPLSVETSDLTLTGNVGGSVTAVQLMNGNTTAHFTVHFANGGSVTASIGAGAITANGCNGNAAFSGNYTVEGPAPCAWAAAAPLPTPGVRQVGVFYPANGKFYSMGGRAFDGGGGEFSHPFEYDPVGNSWTTKSATYPDFNVNNMACAVLNDLGTDYIYCVGGSQSGVNTVTGRVFRYNPVTDSLTTVAGGDWPPGVNTLPGGFSVFSNKLYIFGGFDNPPSGNSTNQIWEYTPGTNAWVQKGAVLPVPLSYIPAATIGSIIYTGGGASIVAGALTPTTNSYQYDPGADSITTIANIPRPTDNTRGFNFCNQLRVPGGDDTTFPNPTNEVDIYDPVSNSWSLGTPMTTARRNFATDTDGTDNVWAAGGYDTTGLPTDLVEVFNCPVSPCGSSPTPTPTATATATATATPTPTATPPLRATPTPRPRPTPAPRP